MISAIARHVAFFIYPRFNLIDLSGPLDAFAVAANMVPNSYRFTIMSLGGGEIESGAGARVVSSVAIPTGIDTLVIVGDAGMADREVSAETIEFIRMAAAGSAPHGERLHGRVSARRERAPRRAAGDDPLALCGQAAGDVSGRTGRERPDLPQ